MVELALTLGIYTVLVLVFVPLEKIGRAQKKVKLWVDKAVKKLQQ